MSPFTTSTRAEDTTAEQQRPDQIQMVSPEPLPAVDAGRAASTSAIRPIGRLT